MDVDNAQDLTNQFEVSCMPTLVFLVNGEQKDEYRIEGYNEAKLLHNITECLKLLEDKSDNNESENDKNELDKDDKIESELNELKEKMNELKENFDIIKTRMNLVENKVDNLLNEIEKER